MWLHWPLIELYWHSMRISNYCGRNIGRDASCNFPQQRMNFETFSYHVPKFVVGTTTLVYIGTTIFVLGTTTFT